MQSEWWTPPECRPQGPRRPLTGPSASGWSARSGPRLPCPTSRAASPHPGRQGRRRQGCSPGRRLPCSKSAHEFHREGIDFPALRAELQIPRRAPDRPRDRGNRRGSTSPGSIGFPPIGSTMTSLIAALRPRPHLRPPPRPGAIGESPLRSSLGADVAKGSAPTSSSPTSPISP